jgi:hypothetical protein
MESSYNICKYFQIFVVSWFLGNWQKKHLHTFKLFEVSQFKVIFPPFSCNKKEILKPKVKILLCFITFFFSHKAHCFGIPFR